MHQQQQPLLTELVFLDQRFNDLFAWNRIIYFSFNGCVWFTAIKKLIMVISFCCVRAK